MDIRTSPFDPILLDKPLKTVFWLYGVVLSQLLWGASMFVYMNGAALDTVVLMFAVLLAYTAWILMSIWHCSWNVENPAHGEIARFLTAAWALNSVLMMAFLLMQRLG